MSELATSASASASTAEPGAASATALVVAGLTAAAGVIHFAMVPQHAGGSTIDPLGFAVTGWFQLSIAAMVISGRARRSTWLAATVGNLAIAGLWLWSRTKGLPVGDQADTVLPFNVVDVSANAMGLGAALLSIRLYLAPHAARSESSPRFVPALFAIAALGLATTVITSPDAASHGASTPAVDAMTAQMATIDRTRCDKDLNIASYWKETKALGIDTYQGGAMATGGTTAAAVSSDGSHGVAASPATTTTTKPDPTEGRGSPTLDRLTSYTEGARVSEAAAAQLVIALGEASDAEYQNWLWWLRASGTVGNSHAAPAPTDSGGHGGEIGPQPWVAMTDKAQCAKLKSELALARKTALAYPHPADAEAAGWRKVTGYVPGIAAHYMKYSAIDDEFHIEEPEMLLYDGDNPDANIIGLSYYMIHDGTAAPTQGFTGPNDSFHRHVGLCSKDGVIIGDSQSTVESCEAAGGRKQGGGKGWMNHVWIVPGCESPWGVFSAATPVLDGQLGRESGTDGGSCAGSGVRDRYGMGESGKASFARSPGN